jgi:aryl-alcohol dehydrogenase-like predicted oxidoreductase
MASNGDLFYTRSIFLQGLLLSKTSDLPNKYKKYENIFQALGLVAESMGVNSLDLCLSYISEIAWSSGNIVAAASIPQLEDILSFKQVDIDFGKFERLPEVVLDPRRWSELK